MDDADRAARSEEWLMKAAQEERKPEGPRPILVSLCLNCGKVIERRIINIVDALEIEAAWSTMLESKEKRLLQEAYGNPTRPLWITCRRVGIRPRHYEQHLALAIRMLHNVLSRATLR